MPVLEGDWWNPLYSSKPTQRIYQKKPPFSKPSQFKPKGWTDSIEGYIREAKKFRTQLFLNRKLTNDGYTFHVVINFDKLLTPQELRDIWSKATLTMKRRGVVAVWVMEPTRSGKFHFHLLLRNKTTKKQLEQAIKDAMPQKQPDQKRSGWRKKIVAVKDGEEWELENYIVKAKQEGYVKGQWSQDRYTHKRLLFVPKLGLKKVGKIGEFWAKPREVLWQGVIDREQRIGEGLQNPGVRKLAKYICHMLNGEVSLEEVLRSYGYSADEPWVQAWIAELVSGDPELYTSQTPEIIGSSRSALP